MFDKITASEWVRINEIITHVYESDKCPDLCNLTQKIGSLIHFSHSMNCLISDASGNFEFFNFQSTDLPQEHIREYCNHYVHYDFIQWYTAVPKPLVFRESDIIVEEYMAESLFMKEWLEPMNIYYGAVMNIAANNHSYANICFYRSKNEGDFSSADMIILKALNQHLCIRFAELFPNGIHYNSFNNRNFDYALEYNLTPRENDIVTKICQGTLRKDLSKRLSISENTIKNHLNKIYKKMNVINFNDLINKLNPSIRTFE